MNKKNLRIIFPAYLMVSLFIISCSAKDRTSTNNSRNTITENMLNIDLGTNISTLDPQLAEDLQSTRVSYDLFEGLLSSDQNNQPIPGLAEKWEISNDGKTYTFHIRPNIKFSDGSPITIEDIIFSYERLVDPKNGSPYSFLINNVVNAENIINGKLPPEKLGIKALNDTTLQITLNHPDTSFLAICAMPNLAIVPKNVVTKFKGTWTDPKHIVSSGAYKLVEYIVNGHILESKNPYYYDAQNVAIEKIQFFPIEDSNSALSQYKAGHLDMTYSLPVDQYKSVKAEFPDEVHTVLLEGIGYYDFNMMLPKFKDNLKLRKALSMGIDREVLVKNVLGQAQAPLYSYVTSTIENGKFADLKYEWESWSRDKQFSTARQLFKEAGYSKDQPLQIKISYNTNDGNKKNALAISAMWQNVFGAKSIQVSIANQEFKTFLQTRHKGSYDIARDAWIADYSSVDSYTNLYQCNNPQNNSHSCTSGYNDLVREAQTTVDSALRIELMHNALKLAMDNYVVIPLYQYTYYRLVSSRVKGYNIEDNHLDHVMSKWFKLN